ncbi:recombinase family protein, partial [Actibacterium sp. 188UL27-1]|uniref:recombinase family protein n=1 Tax=Actibacterium sp. 188UL27-1 TaxID=2786961 RepID=UPI00195E6DCA
MLVGYARVSTQDQHLDAQIETLKEAGAERIWSEKVSGSKADRLELHKLIDHLRPEDVVIVTKYDRLSRSLQDLLTIV